MRILLTGLNGFIGKSLLKNLPNNYEIISLVRTKNKTYSKKNLLEIEGDLSDTESWISNVRNFAPECCIHLAWDGLPNYSLRKCQENLNQNLNLFKSLIDISIKRVVIAGTCWEYGNQKGAVNEQCKPIDPSLFGITKLSILSFYEKIFFENKINYKWARIFFSYGPHQRGSSIIPTIYRNIRFGEKNIINSPNIYQDYIYVDDVSRALVAMSSDNTPSGIYNVGSGELFSVAEIAEVIYSYYGLKSPFESFKSSIKKGFWADNNKSKNLLNWEPGFSLNDGIKKTLESLDHINGFN